MKKFLILLALLSLYTMANAEITKEHDSFDGNVYVDSKISSGVYPFSHTVLSKSKTSAGINYILLLMILEKEWYIFETTPLEIKIGENIYEAPIGNRDSEVLTTEALTTSGAFLIKEDLIDKIKNATHITIRVTFVQKGWKVWHVPSFVLNEWKEVINTAL